MGKVLNRIQTKKKRQYLRKNLTTAEKILWSKLRGRRLGGLKLRRQCGVGNFVVDFHCPELKLAIEVDGDVHAYIAKRKSDLKKEEYLRILGIKLLRFTNGNIRQEMDGLLEQILSNQPPTPPYPGRGE